MGTIDRGSVLPLEEALVLLAEAEEARREADGDPQGVLGRLGLGEGTGPDVGGTTASSPKERGTER